LFKKTFPAFAVFVGNKEVNLENAFHKGLHKQSRGVVAQEEVKD
jgi:hypothetical protein